MQRLQARTDDQQERQMRCFAGLCPFMFNSALALQKERHERGEKKLGYAGMCRLLTEWRNIFPVACCVFFLLYPLSVLSHAQESVDYTQNRRGRCIPSIPFDSKAGEILSIHWRDGTVILPIPPDGTITHRSDVNMVILTSGYAPGACVEAMLVYNDSEWTRPFKYQETYYAYGFVDPYGRVLIKDALRYYDGPIN